MPKILFIDDEPVIRFIGKKTLEQAGFEVTLAENAQDGLAHFTAQEYDLVITDLALPGQVGFSNVLKMRKIRAKQSFLVVSGGDLGSQQFLKEKEEAGITHTLAKPFDLVELVKCAKKCIANKAA